MNNSNIRFLSFASLSLFIGLTPLACGDDDGDSPGTAGKGGTSSTAGKANVGGEDNGGTSNGGTTNGGNGGTGNGGALNVGGEGNGVGGGEGGAGGQAAVAKSRLRVVHASPNAPAVDIYVKGASTATVENVAYGKATEFLEVDAGTIAFDLRAAGAEVSEDAAFTSEDITLEEGAEYTLVAAGELGAEDEEVSFRILPLQHDFDAAEAGVAQARVVHATTAWEDVDLDLASTEDAVDLPGLARFGSETVALPTTATDDVSFSAADAVVSELVLPKLASESEVFVIATGNPGFPFRAPANGFALLVVDQDGKTSWVKENPWIHVLHASDVGTVDFYTSAAPTVKLEDNLAQGALGAFQLRASTTGYTLKAVDADAPNGSVTNDAQGTTSTLLVGEHYLSYLAGDQIRTIREQFDLTQTDKVLLRGVHGVKAGAVTAGVDFGPVNVAGTDLTSVLVAGVAPGVASSTVTGDVVEPGALTLGVAATGTTTPVLATLALTGTASTPAAPVAGERDFVLVTGATAGAAKLYVVDTSVAGWSVR